MGGFCLNAASGCGLRWSMDSTPTLSAPDTISANLRMILRGILAALGMWRVEPALACVLFNRISGTFGRIERILQRFRAGRLWRRTPRDVVRKPSAGRKRSIIMPRRFGWLVQAGKHQAAAFGLQLQTVLTTPEMSKLLAASPQARRILRPLCRALAVELPALADTACKAPAERGETRRRGCRPRTTPEPWRIPLPRGVRSWARREGFGKIH